MQAWSNQGYKIHTSFPSFLQLGKLEYTRFEDKTIAKETRLGVP